MHSTTLVRVALKVSVVVDLSIEMSVASMVDSMGLPKGFRMVGYLAAAKIGRKVHWKKTAAMVGWLVQKKDNPLWAQQQSLVT